VLRSRFQINRIRTRADLLTAVQRHGTLLAECAELLVQAVEDNGGLRNATIIRICHKEREADELVQMIHHAPAIEPARMRRLCDACETVLDRLEDTASSVSATAVAGRLPEDLVEACRGVRDCTNLIRNAVLGVCEGIPPTASVTELRATRKAIETRLRDTCERLLNRSEDQLLIVQLQNLLSFLQRTLDAIKVCANALGEHSDAR